MDVEINVLGSLEISINGKSIVPNANKPRHVLAMLAMNVTKLVTNSALIEELWAHKAPRSAHSTLQTYVLNLRNRIRDALPAEEKSRVREILGTRHAGYVLQTAAEASDAVRYIRVAMAGRAASAAGDHNRAARLLSDALALWRGPVLADVSVGPQLEIEAMQLEERRLADLTLRIDMDLYLGRHHQVLGDLAALCARHPYMENFLAQFMLALYRSGRPGQALEVYLDMSTTIREHLGVGPSSRLRDLHRAILTSDPVLTDPRFMINSWQRDAIAS